MEKGGEFRGTPNGKAEGNPEPSSEGHKISEKVQRLEVESQQ